MTPPCPSGPQFFEDLASQVIKHDQARTATGKRALALRLGIHGQTGAGQVSNDSLPD
jgi:hypothetical protein